MSERPALALDTRLAHRRYYERKAMYEHLGAHFLEWEEIQKRDAWSLVGVLRTLPGVRIRHVGGRRIEITNRSGFPLRVCIEGHRAGSLRDARHARRG